MSMTASELKASLEAIIYAADEPVTVEQMARAYGDLLEHVVSAAELETTLRKLLNEIEKTKRRVNALEFVVIPRMRSQAQFINLRLEEMERENIFRMKRIKAKAG